MAEFVVSIPSDFFFFSSQKQLLRRAFATTRFVYCRSMGERSGAELPPNGKEFTAVCKYAMRRYALRVTPPGGSSFASVLRLDAPGLTATTGFSRSVRGWVTRRPLTAGKRVTEWRQVPSTTAPAGTLIPVEISVRHSSPVASASQARRRGFLLLGAS